MIPGRFTSCLPYSKQTVSINRRHDKETSSQIRDDNSKICYLDELAHVLQKYGIDSKDIMLVGSAVLTNIGCRPNNDIEFCCNREAYRKIPFRIRFELLFHDHYDMSPNVDLFRNRYAVAGLKDKDIWERHLFVQEGEFKTVDINVEYCYKVRMNRAKDTTDIAFIKSNVAIKDKFDENLIDNILNSVSIRRYSPYVKFRKISWNYIAKINRVISRIVNTRGGGE